MNLQRFFFNSKWIIFLSFALGGSTFLTNGCQKFKALSVSSTELASESGRGDSANIPNENGLFVSWKANLETDVNAPGGGYRVYYGQGTALDLDSAESVTVNHSPEENRTPTSAFIPLEAPGDYLVVVVAFSKNLPEGGVPSAPIEVTIQ